MRVNSRAWCPHSHQENPALRVLSLEKERNVGRVSQVTERFDISKCVKAPFICEKP